MNTRRKSIAVKVGDVVIGGGAPIVVQAMTATDTSDVIRTAAEVKELTDAGSEIVRVTVNNEAAARAVPELVERLAAMNVAVPLVGDFHFNGHKLLEKHPACAEALSKLRINPGNVGAGQRRDAQFAKLIECACKFDKPVRIGVNWGSLDQALLSRLMDENAQRKTPKSSDEVVYDALIQSALESAAHAEALGLPRERIVLSCKLSHVNSLLDVYRRLAAQCDYALHIGLTEAGMGRRGTVASTAALSILLAEGIGDTIRVSLTPEPGQSRSEEVRVARDILQSLGLRSFSPVVVACPGCGRTTSDFFRTLAGDVSAFIDKRMPEWRSERTGVGDMTVAVMGCVVNGPGESRRANIGISLPGSGERPVAPVYVDGEKTVTLKGDDLGRDFMQIIEEYVATHYARRDA